MHCSDTTIVTFEESQQHVGEIEPRAFVEPAHDSKIDRHKRPVGRDEHVAGVHIGMEEAITKYLIEEDACGLGKDTLDVVSRFFQGINFVDRKTLDTIRRKDPTGGPQPIDLWHPKLRIVQKVLAKLGGRCPLEAHVHFQRYGVLEHLHNFHRPQPPQAWT